MGLVIFSAVLMGLLYFGLWAGMKGPNNMKLRPVKQTKWTWIDQWKANHKVHRITKRTIRDMDELAKDERWQR